MLAAILALTLTQTPADVPQRLDLEPRQLLALQEERADLVHHRPRFGGPVVLLCVGASSVLLSLTLLVSSAVQRQPVDSLSTTLGTASLALGAIMTGLGVYLLRLRLDDREWFNQQLSEIDLLLRRAELRSLRDPVRATISP